MRDDDDARSVMSKKRPPQGRQGKSLVGGMSRRGLTLNENSEQTAQGRAVLQAHQEKQRELSKTLEATSKRLNDLRMEYSTAQTEWGIQEKTMERELEMTAQDLENDRRIATARRQELKQALDIISALKQQFLEACTLAAAHFIPADREDDQILLSDIQLADGAAAGDGGEGGAGAGEANPSNRGSEPGEDGKDGGGAGGNGPAAPPKRVHLDYPPSYHNMKRYLLCLRRDVEVLERGGDAPDRDMPCGDDAYDVEMLSTPSQGSLLDPHENSTEVTSPQPPSEAAPATQASSRTRRLIATQGAPPDKQLRSAKHDDVDNKDDSESVSSKRSANFSDTSGLTSRSGQTNHSQASSVPSLPRATSARSAASARKKATKAKKPEAPVRAESGRRSVSATSRRGVGSRVADGKARKK